MKVMKGTTSNPVHGHTRNFRVAPTNPEQWSQVSAKPAPAPEASAPTSDIAPESNNVPEEGTY